ncbi:MAG: hypothetical protein ACOCTI_06175 [Phycisphaeraceae bacterium]
MVASAVHSGLAYPADRSYGGRCPFYPLVPTGFQANVEFRKRMIRLGQGSREHARELWIMCKRDPLFWFNVFGWTYDPRKDPAAIPFITYPFQNEAILELDGCIGKEDVLFEKSRDMGASWMCLATLTWRWWFHDLLSFLMVSRNEDYVDRAGNPKALFWKVDYLLEHAPGWLRPRYTRQRLHLRNEDTGSVIDGESTTGDVARGDRRTAILKDEFAAFGVEDGYKAPAATGDATNCRIFNFTPRGTGNAAYDMARSSVRKIRLHWTRHPEKAAGLWYDDEGKPRSPWYDRECARRPIPMLIAQELDIDYLGSSYQFFDSEVLDRAAREDVRPPLVQGELSVTDDGHPAGVSEQAGGRLRLWFYPDALGSEEEFVVAGDVATGTGSSNSVLSIGNRKTREKVGEFAASEVKPHELAKIAVALCRWLNQALLIWEANGPGRIFGDTVLDLGHRVLYYRQNERSLGKPSTDTPGWYATRENKLTLLGEYRRALGAQEFINRSEEAVKECREYVFQPSGAVEHSRSASTVDPTGARDNHGDRVIADALLWKGLRESGEQMRPSKEVPEGSFLWRREREQAARRQEVMW